MPEKEDRNADREKGEKWGVGVGLEVLLGVNVLVWLERPS